MTNAWPIEFGEVERVRAHRSLCTVDLRELRRCRVDTDVHPRPRTSAHPAWRGGALWLRYVAPQRSETEDRCGCAAAEFLGPAQEVRARWQDAEKQPGLFDPLTRAFILSPVVAARRAYDLKLIARQAVMDFYEGYAKPEREWNTKAAGDELLTTRRHASVNFSLGMS